MDHSNPFLRHPRSRSTLPHPGGLKVDSRARVLRPDGLPIVGLYSGGRTAVVISGKAYKGYSSGNGLLATTVLGEVSDEAVAEELAGDARRA